MTLNTSEIMEVVDVRGNKQNGCMFYHDCWSCSRPLSECPSEVGLSRVIIIEQRRKVVALQKQGKDNKTIARAIGMSERTIERRLK